MSSPGVVPAVSPNAQQQFAYPRIVDHKKHPDFYHNYYVGTYFFQNGTYVGQFMHGKLHGYGSFFFNSGNRYTGEWRNNKMHGKGMYYSHAKSNYHVGMFKNGKLNGRGILYKKNGGTLEGRWVDDKKHGRMILRKPRNPESFAKEDEDEDDLLLLDMRDLSISQDNNNNNNNNNNNDSKFILFEQVWNMGKLMSQTRIPDRSPNNGGTPTIADAPVFTAEQIEENRRLKAELEAADLMILQLKRKIAKVKKANKIREKEEAAEKERKKLEQLEAERKRREKKEEGRRDHHHHHHHHKEKKDRSNMTPQEALLDERASRRYILCYFQKGTDKERSCKISTRKLRAETTGNLYNILKRYIRDAFDWHQDAALGITLQIFYTMTDGGSLIEIKPPNQMDEYEQDMTTEQLIKEAEYLVTARKFPEIMYS